MNPINPSDIISERSLRTDSSTYNAGTKAMQLIHEERNTAQNWKPIMDALASGRARDINDEPKQVGKPPCFLISSGPSLDDNIEQLRGWKGAIFCSTSHATTLMYYGIEPTYIVILDPFCSWSEISGVDWAATKTKIIVNPSVWPDIYENWPNEMLLFLQNVGRRESFYATTQKHMFTRREPDTAAVRTPTFRCLIHTEITLFACTPPAELFCAEILGYGRVFLAGCDYCFSPTKERFTRWQPTIEDQVWRKEEVPFKPDQPNLVRTDNGGISHVHHVYYKKNHVSAWRLSLQDCWSVDRYTALTEVPHTNMARVIRSQGEDFKDLPKAEIIRRTERYLARVGAYILQSSAGLSFVEAPNPLEDLPKFMAAGRRLWRCLKCNAQGSSPDDADHSGEGCPACGNVGMQRVTDVDIELNMARIRKLVKQAERDNAKHDSEHAVSVESGCGETVIGTQTPVSGTTETPKVPM